MEKRIVACIIERGKYKNTVHVTYDDKSEEDIFTYYPDELSFSETELIGLTGPQARELHYRKDITYIHN